MEIERKWLVSKDKIPYDLSLLPAYEIVQAYVSFHPTIRVRALTDRVGQKKYVLTVKGKAGAGDMLVREEYEMPIDEAAFDRLSRKAEGQAICKTRYIKKRDDGLTEEIDVFRGALEGLCYLEIEFSDVEQARAFPSPAWTDRDVTYDRRYRNSALAKHGMPKE